MPRRSGDCVGKLEEGMTGHTTLNSLISAESIPFIVRYRAIAWPKVGPTWPEEKEDMSLPSAQKSPSVGGKSPRPGGPSRAVTIQDEPELIGPPAIDIDGSGETPSPRLHRASISGKKLTGRPAIEPSASSVSLVSQLSNFNLSKSDVDVDKSDGKIPDAQTLLSEVVEWLHEEKAKRVGTKAHSQSATKLSDQAGETSNPPTPDPDPQKRTHEIALDKLERILASILTAAPTRPRLGHQTSASGLRRGSLAKKMKRTTSTGQSSDTEHQEADILVPNVEAALDNSKAMAYSGGDADNDNPALTKPRDKENWISFKKEIVRLTHTLKLKGWRRIPIENGGEIAVERLSGALTNAVYVVSPPKKLPEVDPATTPGTIVSKNKPTQLLLRVYGPQVEHLIDREKELAILRRLARKRIGPRMLGTFSNGRFEEFFHARTLTPEDLRIPETSKQIAKRMRELHDGIELLESELDGGPAVFRNWNKWVDRCEKVMTWLDKQVLEEGKGEKGSSSKYTRRGLVCGVEWPTFRKTVEKYQEHIYTIYGGKKGVRKELVFAHNDTQYGNLMRMKPTGESPLLHPVNEHKQLVVIDFEYASANTIGLEFANHFTEWCYNYHHPEYSYSCNTNAYPTEKEQYRFVRSYVMHRPQYNASASATPKMEGKEKTNIPDFMLDKIDARMPQNSIANEYDAEEKARIQLQEDQIQKLLQETRLWRAANSAQWAAWGIVQAKVPELDEKRKSRAAAVVDRIRNKIYPQSDPLDPEVKELQEDSQHDRPEGRSQEEAELEGDEGEGDDHFDHLAYTQERAMFFWGDCLQMGLIKEEDLPESMKGKVKIVKY